MNTNDFNALIGEATKLIGKEVIVKKNHDNGSEQSYVFNCISKGFGCRFEDDKEMNWIVYGKLQLKDGKSVKQFPLQTVIQSIKNNIPIIFYTGNIIIKRKINN